MREHAPRTYRSATHTGTGRRSLESIRSRVGNSFYGTYGIATRPVEEAWLPERGLTHTHAPDARDVPLGRGSTRGDLTRPVSYYVRLIAPAKLAGGLRIVHASCAAPPPVWRGVLSSLWLPPQGSGMMCPQTGTDPYARVEGRGNGLLRPARPSR